MNTAPLQVMVRARRLPLVWCALLLTLVIFTGVGLMEALPVGLLTGDSPPLPLLALQPPLLASLISPAFFSQAHQLERLGARAVPVLHAIVICLTVMAAAGGVIAQAVILGISPTRVLLAFVGYLALVAMGAALWGALGWLLALLMLTMVMVAGTDVLNQPAWWAWPLASMEWELARATMVLCIAAAVTWATRLRAHRGPADE